MKKINYPLIALVFLSACNSGIIHHGHVADVTPVTRLTLIPQDQDTLVKINGIESRSLIGPDNVTAPLQLFAIDPALNDFHLYTPQKTGIPSVYSIPLMAKSGGYRVWADVQPTAAVSKKQLEEFPSADLGAHKPGNINKTPSLEATVDGEHFTLTFANVPTIDDESIGTIYVKSEDGKRTISSGSVYVFYDDFRTVTRLPLNDTASFTITPKRVGFAKLFAVVKLGEKTYTIPFATTVAKAN